MKKLINFPKFIFFAFAFFLMISIGYSQPQVPGGGDDVQDEAPISSLVVLGLVAGTVFGVKKLK